MNEDYWEEKLNDIDFAVISGDLSKIDNNTLLYAAITNMGTRLSYITPMTAMVNEELLKRYGSAESTLEAKKIFVTTCL